MALPSRNFPSLMEKAVCCGEVGDGRLVRCLDKYSRVSRMEESSGARLTGRTGTEREGQKGEWVCARSEESRCPGVSGRA